MISFTILTTTPVEVRNFLISRGIIQQVTDKLGQTQLVGVLPGLEFTVNSVPNPIVTNPGSGGDPRGTGYVPPTYDSRLVYLVKATLDTEADQIAGFPQTDPAVINTNGPPGPPTIAKPIDLRTKLGQWVQNNGVRNDVNVNGTVLPAYLIGTTVWLVRDTNGLLGSWQ